MSLSTSEQEQFKFSVGREADKFVRWKSRDDAVQRFDPASTIAFVMALGAALATIDKNLSSAEKLFARLKGLYGWITKSVPEKTTDFSPGERVLVVVADAYAQNRGGIACERIAAVTGLPFSTVAKLLEQYDSLRIVRKRQDQDDWIFRPAAQR
jgi:hypothetical protein